MFVLPDRYPTMAASGNSAADRGSESWLSQTTDLHIYYSALSSLAVGISTVVYPDRIVYDTIFFVCSIKL